MDHDNECPICLDELENKNICVLECKHKFHENCITVYVLSKQDRVKEKIKDVHCPMCRHKINVIIDDDKEKQPNNVFIFICMCFIFLAFLGIYINRD